MILAMPPCNRTINGIDNNAVVVYYCHPIVRELKYPFSDCPNFVIYDSS